MKRKAPFGLFIRKNEDKTEDKKAQTKRNKRSKRLSDRQILRELSRVIDVSENDIPKTFERFKKEIEEMKKHLTNV